jgi:hypothetical protein
MNIKKFIIGLLIILNSNISNAFGIKDLHQIIHDPKKYLMDNPALMRKQIFHMLNRRCHKYALNKNEECESASIDFVNLLDLKQIELSSGKYVVTYSKDLEQLHNDKTALALLKDIEKEILILEEKIKLYKFIAPKKIKQLDIGELAF